MKLETIFSLMGLYHEIKDTVQSFRKKPTQNVRQINPPNNSTARRHSFWI